MKEIKNYAYIENLELTEYIAVPIYIIIILLISYYIQQKYIRENPVYKYYTRAVFVKIVGAIGFCMVYIYVYKGGDTISYFETSRAVTNLLFERPGDFMKVITENASMENYYLFDSRTTGFPWVYMYFSNNTFLVAKILVPFMVVSFKSYLLSTILLSWASFFGIWRLFLVFSTLYKPIAFQLSLAILYIPSVVFWGSGILKDTITLSASCWFIYGLYHSMIVKDKPVKGLIIILISGYLVFSIKSYILFALLPGVIIWVIYDRIVNVRSRFFKYSIIPLIYIFSFSLGYGVLSLVGDFNIKKLLGEASVKQNDLKRTEYSSNSFDIGDYDPTILGAATVSPAALVAGLYRPFLWEPHNIVMVLSGLENFIYLTLTLLIFVRIKFTRLLKILFENPLLLFCLSYSILLALIIGLSTSNFGALVRFKIAFLPEFLSALLILYYFVKNKKLTKMN